ncbi:alpha/beta hydrolase [Collimonas sp. H4R21]|uniref:Alpha/beta hydrolase n=1 Tax=Collimonas rhizosphaerae TaxID=3126357 RepID=A0ABU9PWS1_9BURK
MSILSNTAVGNLLVSNIPRDLIMGVEDALQVGALRAYQSASVMNKGHLPHALGQMRHFNMNETFHDALAAADANPTPVRGNSLIVGQSGIFVLSRLNVSSKIWNNAKRSKTRRKLCHANFKIEPLVQPGFFDDSRPVVEGAVFFVASFSGSMRISPESPQSIDIAVPNAEMTSWLFREPLSQYVLRYESTPVQDDQANPILKTIIHKKLLNGAEE